MALLLRAVCVEGLESRVLLSGVPQAVMVSRAPAVLQDFDRTTGALSNPRVLAIDGVMDVEYDGDGNLYVVTDSRASKGQKNSLYKINPVTAETTLVGSLGAGDLYEGDLAWDKQHKKMTVVTDRLNGGATSFTVNLTTGAASDSLRLGVDGQQPFDSNGASYNPATGNLDLVDGGYNGPLYGYSYQIPSASLSNQVAGTLVMGTTGALAYDTVNNRFILGSGGTDFGFGKKGSYIYEPATGKTTALSGDGDYSGLAFGYPADEAPPSISISDAAVAEGDPGNDHTLEFKLTLSRASTVPVTVIVTTRSTPSTNGVAATSGTDYVAISRLITFEPGTVDAVFSVRTIGDNDAEENEVFDVDLTKPTGATISRASAIGTILNDDGVGKGKLKIISVKLEKSKSAANEFIASVTVKNTSLGPISDKLLLTSFASMDTLLDLDKDAKLNDSTTNVALRRAQTALIVMPVDVPPAYFHGGGYLLVQAVLLKSKEKEVAASGSVLPAVTTFGGGSTLRIPDPADSKTPLAIFKTSTGTASVEVDDKGSITLKLNKGADAEIAVKKGKTYSIKGVEAEKVVKGLKALGVDIEKDIRLAGGASSVQVGSLRDGHTLTLGGSSKSPVTLSLGRVAETVINSTQPIKSLAVTDWVDADGTPDVITAPSIGAIASTGDKKAKIAGDFAASIRTSGAIASLDVAGQLGSGIAGNRREIRAGGAIGTVKAAKFVGVNILSGLVSDAAITEMPSSAAVFVTGKKAGGSAIESIIATGKGKSGLFAASLIAAARIGTVSLAGVDTASAVPLGVAGRRIDAYTRDGKKKSTKSPGDVETDGNYVVRVLGLA